MAKADFGGEAVGLITMLDKRRAVPAAVLVERGAAVDAILVPVAAEDQAVTRVKGQVVLPVQRIAIGVEHRALVAEFIQGLLAVLGMAELDAGFPDVVDPGVEVAADAADIKIAVRLLLHRLEGVHVEAAERVVELALATVIQQIGADFDVIGQRMAEAQTNGLIAVGIVIAIARIRLVRTINPGGFIKAGAEIETGFVIAAGQTEAAFPRLVAAETDVHAWLQTLLSTASGENLNHTTNRITAVNHRTRAAQHFHTLDLLDVQMLQIAVARSRVADALTIDQHQALRRLRAANIDSRQTAAPTGLRHLHTRHATQQVRHVARLQAVDVFTGEYGVGGAAVVACFDLAVGGDQRVRQLQRLITLEVIGDGISGRQQEEGQGEAREFHGNPSGISGVHKYLVSTKHCGSGLAREGVSTFNIDVGCADLFAGKPAPTGIVC